MKKYLYPPQPAVVIPINNSNNDYEVARIFCIGRNYADHVREMGGSVERETPVYFTKPANSILVADKYGVDFPYSLGTENLHYEMELVVALKSPPKPIVNISHESAENLICGYACGLDMTRRDLQALAKKNTGPWDLGKAFENSAVVSPLTLVEDCGLINHGFIRLSQNKIIKQNSALEEMIWKIPEIISNLSKYYHLGSGDLIFTGTPEGVGAVKIGDVLEGEIEKVDKFKITICKNEEY